MRVQLDWDGMQCWDGYTARHLQTWKHPCSPPVPAPWCVGKEGHVVQGNVWGGNPNIRI